MSGEASKPPDWLALLDETNLEPDRDLLAKKVQKLEESIFERLQEPFQPSIEPIEREVLNSVLSTLRTIKRDKLGFPDWK